MLAFFDDKKIKEKYLSRVEAHYQADEIIHGKYWENGKGCAVGCTIEGSEHSRYETELGIPRAIARLEDRIFEGLQNGESKEFPVKFLKAIKVGADLSLVTPKFMLWLLSDPKDGVLQYAKTERTRQAIQTVIDIYSKKLEGKKITTKQWETARRAADAAAAAAAYAAAAYAAAAYAAAAYAADDAAAAYAAAADAAAAYAAYAAYAAAADDAADARSKHYSKQAKKLLSLLRECK